MSSKKGFTLVELLAVIVILAVILAIAIPGIASVTANATRSSFEDNAKMILNAIRLKMLEDNSLDFTSINETNIKSILNINDSNYESIQITEKNGEPYILIAGKNKWSNLVVSGVMTDIVVHDKLIFWLDAGNIKSYPGTGTIWYDFSGNSNNVSLISSPTYTSSNGGGITFDGTSQYGLISNPNSLYFDANFTIIVWFKPKSALTGSTDIRQTLYSGDTGSSLGLELGNFTNSCVASGQGTEGYRFLMHKQSSCFANISNTNQFSQNQTLQFAYTRSQNRNGKMYVNGNLINNVNDETSFIYSAPNVINIARRGNGGNQYFNGDIYFMLGYNRELSGTEIKHNFDDYRNRFGI